ncbi:hypothetical protein INR49_007107 [Caranx melampygus]|nr:hypothetical protein INR49_007107 [Caranx melampygus]
MSLYGSFLSDEQFQCSICLDVFNNPSTTPCGHSFCMGCINRYWDGSKVCQCPLCKKTFQKKPDLHINRTLREITEQFRSMRGGGLVGRERRGGRGGVGEGALPDNLFNELKKKLPQPPPKPWMTSSFDAQSQGNSILEFPPSSASLASSVPNDSPIVALNNSPGPPPPPPSYSRSNGRRRFTVSGAASSQSLPLCEIHQRGIMIYCRTDRVCVCPDCEAQSHQGHDTVPVEDEWMEAKSQLSVLEQQIQEMIRQRIRKVEEIRTSVAEVERAVERETAGSVGLFFSLVSAIERSQAELIEVLEMSRRAAAHQADVMIRQLELEVEELRRRGCALAELAQSDDHNHCLKTFPILSSPPPARDWSGVSVNSDLGTGTIYRSLASLVERFQGELKNIAETGFPALALEPSPVQPLPRMRRVQEYAAEHPHHTCVSHLVQVRCGDRHQMLPDHPDRFDRVVCVLGREAISSGRHYWEVSFYNVDAKIHIYTFNDTFTECILPFFSPCTNKSGKNDGPLIITPVNTIE